MPLAYPIAGDAASALASARLHRTQKEAVDALGGPAALVCEWLRPGRDSMEPLREAVERGFSLGFVQVYEDDAGEAVLAVTFWKPVGAAAVAGRGGPAEPTGPARAAVAAKKPRRKRASRKVDPNQLDLFAGPDQQGYESRDPNNPLVVIVDEEGDGAAFGGPAAGEV